MVPVWQETTTYGADRLEAEARLGDLARRCRRLFGIQRLRGGARPPGERLIGERPLLDERRRGPLGTRPVQASAGRVGVEPTRA